METRLSISLFKTNTFAAVMAILVILPCAVFYTLQINPEILFWKKSLVVKSSYAHKLSSTGLPKIVFTGGSSCAFQVDAYSLTQKFDIPSVNVGLHAGMGAIPIVSIASTFLNRGDILILMIEPSLLSANDISSSLGKQSLLSFGPEKELYIPALARHDHDFLSLVLSCRPGLQNLSTMLGKLLLRRKPYRYTEQDLHEGGFISTKERLLPSPLAGNPTLNLSKSGETLLKELNIWAKGHDVRVYYLMPLSLVSRSSENLYRKSNLDFLTEIGKIIPVIPDPALGVAVNPEDFADSVNHLTKDAAELRTKDIAEILTNFHLKR